MLSNCQSITNSCFSSAWRTRKVSSTTAAVSLHRACNQSSCSWSHFHWKAYSHWSRFLYAGVLQPSALCLPNSTLSWIKHCFTSGRF